MTTFFYILFFLNAILEGYLIMNSWKIFKMMEITYKHNKITGRINDVNFNLFSSEYKPSYLIAWAFSQVTSIIFSLIGLLSSNWILFLLNISVFLCLRVVLFFCSKLESFKFSKAHYILILITALIVLINSLFIVINFFHLKINIYDYIKS